MKIDRQLHPHVSEEDLQEFLDSLKPMEKEVLFAKVIEDYEEDNEKIARIRKNLSALISETQDTLSDIRNAQNLLEEASDGVERLRDLLSGKEIKS